jgi:hypothetical protein
MGKRWDASGIAYDTTLWTECLRVLKPGGHLIAFGGTRTYHRMTVAIEDAGFEIRDSILWLYATGFPKGLDVAWQLHKKASSTCGIMVVDENIEDCNERTEQKAKYQMRFVRASYLSTPVYACIKCGQVLQPFMQEQGAQAIRKTWEQSEVGWSKQSCMERWDNIKESERELRRCEVCTLSHGVFADGSQGWIHHGTPISNGAIPWQIANEDGSRPSYRPQSIEQLHNQFDAFLIECRAQEIRGFNVALKPAHEPAVLARKPLTGTVADNVLTWGVGALNIDGCRVGGDAGRWPANVILDEHAAEALDEQSGRSVSKATPRHNQGVDSVARGKFKPTTFIGHTDSGGASRFFYIAKASRAEREAGLDAPAGERACTHPTVKPIALMRYLMRLVTPKGGTVLDPFMGSGSTGCAAMLEGMRFVGIDITAEYVDIAERRIQHWLNQNPMEL